VAEPESPPRPTPLRRELRAFLELFALAGFALAYPLLDLYGRAPEIFVFRNATTTQIVGFALLVTVMPPVVLWVVEALVGLISQHVRRWVHVVLVAALVGIFAVQALRPLTSGAPLMVLGALVGIGAAALYVKAEPVRLWVAFAAAAPLLFLGLFLTASDTAQLIRSTDLAAATTSVGNPVPVVMVVFDELPTTTLVDGEGRIDAELYPNLAELADRSHWFRNATAVSTSTWHAMPSLLSGRYPQPDRAPLASDHPETLFSLLADTYELNVTESITRLCSTEMCEPTALVPGGLGVLVGDAVDLMRARLSPAGVQADPTAAFVEAPTAEPTTEESGAPDRRDEDGNDEGDETWADFDLNQPARLRALLDGLATDTGRPQLHYLHLLLPHVPYRYLPSGAQYPGVELDRDDDVWTDEPWLVSLARQRHVLQTAYVDRLVGELTASLREAGIYDEALVIVTADHGIAFQPGRASRALDDGALDDDLLTELMWVPLFVKLPGQEAGEINDDNVSLVDVVPTIADVLEVEIPWDVDGRSALGTPRNEQSKTFFDSFVNPFGVDVGDRVAVELDDPIERLKLAGVDRLLPARGDTWRIWRAGPRSDLVGSTLGEAGPSLVHAKDSELEGGTAFDDVDGRSGTVPALVRGRVSRADTGDVVAVAVNGTVAATSPVFRRGDAPSFAVVVGDEWFRPGANEVTVHLVR
jgi:hypothetical protein